MRELVEQRDQLVNLQNVRGPHSLPAMPHHRDRVLALRQELMTDGVIEQTLMMERIFALLPSQLQLTQPLLAPFRMSV